MSLIAGVDEVGRGCLAGPVVAAVVVFPPGYQNENIKDSKRLTANQRMVLANVIKMDAVTYGIAQVSPGDIDNMNILNATFKAMHLAIDALSLKPTMLLIDGDRFIPYKGIPYKCIVRGDSTNVSIAAASILAKTYRDRLITDLAAMHPQYGWERNKGYGTKGHRNAIAAHGLTKHHRLTFCTKYVLP